MAFALPAAAQSSLPLYLYNDNTDYDASQVYYTFSTAPDLTGTFNASYTDSTTGTLVNIALDPTSGLSNPIQLSSIQNHVIDINSSATPGLQGINSGVLYISLGTNAGLPTSATPNPAGEPGGSIRWTAAVELTYTGNTGDSGDVTQINAFSIPVTIQSLSGSVVKQESSTEVSTATLYNEIKALGTYTPIISTGTTSIMPDGSQLIVKSTDGSTGTPVGDTVRALGPGNLGPQAVVNMTGTITGYTFSLDGFRSFQPYVTSLATNNVSTQIYGTVNQTGTYNFVMTADHSGNLTITGTYAGSPDTYTITIPHDVNTGNANTSNFALSQAIYKGLTPLVTQVTPGADPLGQFGGMTVTSSGTTVMTQAEFAQVLHDVYAGFNLGFVGSTTMDPITGKPFGQDTSTEWFADTAGTKYAFSYLQPDNPYYNEYAALIADTSITSLNLDSGSIYGSSYSDAIPGVAINTTQFALDEPVDGWNIIIEADSVPESSGVGWVAMGLAVLFYLSRREKLSAFPWRFPVKI